MRKRLDAPENRREIARQPSAKNQPRRAKCPAATNATVSGARIFRDNWEVRKNDADPATVRGDEPATATVDAVYGKAQRRSSSRETSLKTHMVRTPPCVPSGPR